MIIESRTGRRVAERDMRVDVVYEQCVGRPIIIRSPRPGMPNVRVVFVDHRLAYDERRDCFLPLPHYVSPSDVEREERESEEKLARIVRAERRRLKKAQRMRGAT